MIAERATAAYSPNLKDGANRIWERHGAVAMGLGLRWGDGTRTVAASQLRFEDVESPHVGSNSDLTNDKRRCC